MKIHSSEIFRSQGRTFCDVSIEDDDPELFADIRGWRDSDGTWHFDRADILEITLPGRWRTKEKITGAWEVAGEIWSELIAAECEAAYQHQRELDAEIAAERRQG